MKSPKENFSILQILWKRLKLVVAVWDASLLVKVLGVIWANGRNT